VAIEIPNAGWYQETTARYDYVKTPGQCPICGGVGLPWRGWFHCDGRCHAIAMVADGRTFLPVPAPRGLKEVPHGQSEG
jgi:hypothetical protein